MVWAEVGSSSRVEIYTKYVFCVFQLHLVSYVQDKIVNLHKIKKKSVKTLIIGGALFQNVAPR